MKLKLCELDTVLKRLLIAYITTLTIGVLIGLAFLNHTTSLSAPGTVDRFIGSSPNEEADELEEDFIVEKSVPEMLMTTHNHILGFSFIFFTVGLILYFNSIVTGKLKMFLLFEPFISIILSFGSIWGIRFIHHSFVYLAMLSAVLLYLSFFVSAGIIFYELIFKHPEQPE